MVACRTYPRKTSADLCPLTRAMSISETCAAAAAVIKPARKRLAADVDDDLPLFRSIMRYEHRHEIIPKRPRKDDKARNARFAQATVKVSGSLRGLGFDAETQFRSADVFDLHHVLQGLFDGCFRNKPVDARRACGIAPRPFNERTAPAPFACFSCVHNRFPRLPVSAISTAGPGADRTGDGPGREKHGLLSNLAILQTAVGGIR
jgi:hypothetical protein